MKYCLSSRLEAKYLAKADEIRVEYRDRHILPDLAIAYPNADLILHYGLKDYVNWEEIKEYNTIAQGRLICCFSNLTDAMIAKNVRRFVDFPIESFSELRVIANLGFCYAYLGPELFFRLDKVKKIGVPVRAMPHTSISASGLLHGPCGQWIRPEDQHVYEEYIETFDLWDDDLTREAALYRIYSEDGWPNNLGLLIKGLECNVDSKTLTSGLAEIRLTCGHRCQATGGCGLCERVCKWR